VIVGMLVCVGVRVGVAVLVAVGVGVSVAVLVGVALEVIVAVTVPVAVAVRVGVDGGSLLNSMEIDCPLWLAVITSLCPSASTSASTRPRGPFPTLHAPGYPRQRSGTSKTPPLPSLRKNPTVLSP
jgi:hypothetical protein